MPELTYKAIAMMCGYRKYMSATSYKYAYRLDHIPGDSGFYFTEDEMWKACCIENDLIKIES